MGYVTGAFALILLSQPKPKPLHFPPARPALYVPTPGGPRLVEVVTKCTVGRGNGKLLVPIPIDYTGQKVVGFSLDCEPKSSLKSWTWMENASKLKRIVAIDLAAESQTEVTVRCLTIAPKEDVVRLQDKNFHLWKEPSAIVSETDQFKELARELTGADQPESRLARWVSSRKPESSTGHTALDALKSGGSWLGRALLSAALARANHSGARLVQYVSSAGAFDGIGWMTEVETEEGRWQPIEPYIGLDDPERNSYVVMGVADLVDEASGRSALIAPAWVGPVENFTVQSHPLKSFPGPAAGRILSSAYQRSLTVADAAMRGVALSFARDELDKAVSGGVLPFCRLLEGH